MVLKLLIVEDAKDVAELIAYSARMSLPDCEVFLATDGMEALRCFNDDAPNLIVLDVAIPPPDGVEVCRRIRETSHVPILMLTARESTADIVRGLESGADDYLTKPYDPMELIARIRALLRRSQNGAATDASSFVSGPLTIDFAKHDVRIGSKRVHLTATEYRLLKELVHHAGTVLPHQVLLERVWGQDWDGESGYLKVLVQRLRRKLGDDAKQAQFISTEHGVGYRFITGE